MGSSPSSSTWARRSAPGPSPSSTPRRSSAGARAQRAGPSRRACCCIAFLIPASALAVVAGYALFDLTTKRHSEGLVSEV